MADFNSYIDKIDMNFWRELCAKEGKLCLYKKGDYFLHCGDTTKNVWGFIKKGYFMIFTNFNKIHNQMFIEKIVNVFL